MQISLKLIISRLCIDLCFAWGERFEREFAYGTDYTNGKYFRVQLLGFHFGTYYDAS